MDLDSPEKKREQIVELGWQQGSLFKLPAEAVPTFISYNPSEEFLILATQSCTVLSPNFVRDPWVEAMVANPKAVYNEKDDKARGNNVRAFLLPVESDDYKAVECDLNRRFFLCRQSLADCAPMNELRISDEGRRNFAGWIARSYTRIALPDELVHRIKPLFEGIKKILKKSLGAKGPLHEYIDQIYIQWDPNEELTSLETSYEVNLLFLCEDDEASEEIDRELAKVAPNIVQGVTLYMSSKVLAETFVSELDPYVRLSQWDYLSNLGDLSEHPLGL